MKKVLIITTMLLALATGAATAQDNQQPQAQQELVDSASKDAIEAYSDTTSTAAVPAAIDNDAQDDDSDDSSFSYFFKSVDKDSMAGMLFVLAVLLIIFVLAPVFIIVAIFYFINKNRRDRMRLAQMAMQQGQPIPNQLLQDQPDSVSDEYQRGLRQCFAGLGLMIFLGYAAGKVGFGIGALVLCIGLGKVVAAKWAKKEIVNKQTYDYDKETDEV